MGLNHVYKVIWSKTKNAWVVVSEIAKRDCKSSVKSVVTSLAGKSVAAVMVAMVMCVGVASAATGTQYGTGATATYNDSVAVGENTKAAGKKAIAIGANATASGEAAIAMGETSNITGTDGAVVLGQNSSITSSVPGGPADKTSTSSLVIGRDSHITDSTRSVAIGSRVNISQTQDVVAIGYSANITNSANALALGILSKVTNAINGIAIGGGSEVTGGAGIAIGAQSKTSGDLSVSIGLGNQVKGNNSSAIGVTSYIDTIATDTHVQGNDNGRKLNPIKASESTFMGNANLAGTAGTTGIHLVGNNNSVNSSNVMVMGNGVTVGTGLDGAVVLGNASSANQYAAATDSTINGVTFEAAGYAGNTGLNNGSIVSVGATGAERQIKNVAAGAVTATSTDAVNGSQLYKTAETILKMPISMAGDSGDTVGVKLGKTVNIKGSVASGADVTDGNIAVVGDKTTSTLSLKMAKNLTGLTSGTFTDTSGNQTVINGAGVTVTPTGTGATRISITTSGINAGNQEIKGVKKGTTDDAAVNKKQMDDAVKAATDSVSTLGDNKVSLGSDAGTTTAKKLSTTGGIKFNIKGDTGANALITTSATGDDVTIAPTAKLSAAVTAAENAANKDLSNLSTAGNTYIQNLAKSAASWNVETNGGGRTAVAGGETVNFINGDNIAITNTGRSITIGTAKNVSFDKITVGGVVIDKNNGIDAGGKEITNVGPATSGNSAVNKTQMDTAITNAVNKASTDAKHDFGGDDTTVVTRKHGEKLNIKGGASTATADLTAGNIAVLGDAATGTLNIRMAKALTGLSSATFTTPSGTTVINGGGMTITPSAAGAAPISITTGGINAGNTEIKNVAAGTTPNSAVNKQQMDSAISNATANVGFNTAGNTGTGSVSNGQTLTITGTNGIETHASGQSITVGLDAATRAQINNATTTANNAAKKDLSNIDNAGKQMIKDTAAWNVKVNSGTPEIVKGGDTVTFNDGDNIKVTNTGKDITIATKKDVSFDKVTVGNVVIDKNTNRISGLANAANNDEAVNLGQMNAAISTATAGTGSIKYKANSGTQNSVALTTGLDFKGDRNIQITADPANSGVINYKLNPTLTGITSISGGAGAPTITLNAGSGSTPGNVSINSNLDMGGKQINNIGAATHAGDAVNKAQMDQALQTIAGASSNMAKSYAYKAGAGAAALAALKPIQYDPLEPTQIMAGIGNYKSQTAVALGVAHYTNENTMFNLGVSLDSHDGMVNAGVTHKFGYGPEKKAIPDKYKGGPISSIYVMQDEVTALQAIVQKQAAENEALRQQNEDMQRKVDMILSKIH